MKTANIKRNNYVSGFLFKNFEEVKAAMYIYLYGTGISDTEKNVIQEGGPIMFALMNIAQSSGEDMFLKRMYDNLSSSFISEGRGMVDYDWDGIGPFHKTSVTIVRANNRKVKKPLLHPIVLTMNAAYVGNDCEKKLAEELKVQRGTVKETAVIEFEAEKENAIIDFSYLAEQLNKTGFVKTTAEKLFNAFLPKKEWGNHFQYTLDIINTNLELNIYAPFGSLEDPIDHSTKKSTFSVDGLQLTAKRFVNKYTEDPKDYPFSLSFSVSQKSIEERNTLPIFDKELKLKMIEIRDTVASVF